MHEFNTWTRINTVKIDRSDEWTLLSLTGRSVNGGIRIDTTVSDGENYFDDFIVIDLTQTFGAGNEPTKEEMDELIKVTGYIDGEYALNNKEMLGNLMKGIGEKANKKQEDWITPTLLNGWTDRVPSNPVRFRKNEFGRVEIEGAIKGGTLGVPAFVLPPGYVSGARYPKVFGGLNYAGLLAEIPVSGNIFSISKSSTTVWISLEGISYEAN